MTSDDDREPLKVLDEPAVPDAQASPRSIRGLITEQRVVAVVYAIAMFMNVMDAQIVNVAIPTLNRDFQTTTASIQWVITGYLMSIAVCVPASGWLGDRFGTKRLFLIAVSVFTIASALCAASQNLDELICMRVLQGAGGGMMVPVGMAMLYRAYPPHRRVQVARLITRVMVIAPASAPIIGGSLVTFASWRWIFTINVPFGIAIVVFGSLFLAEHREPRQGGFDVVGFITGSCGLGLLLYSIGSGPTSGWSSPVVSITGALAVMSIAIFIRTELGREHPILNIRLIGNRPFRRCCSLIAFQTTAFVGTITFIALYLQEGRGLSAINSGLSTFPEAIAIGFSSQLVAKLFPRIGPRRLIAGGFAGLAVITLLLANSGADTSLWLVRAFCACIGVSVSYIMLPSQATAFAQISPADTGHASALFNTLQRAINSFVIAGLSIVLSFAGGEVAHRRPPISSFHWVFYACMGMSILGVLFGLRIRDADAAAVMARGPSPARAEDENRTLAVASAREASVD